MSGDDTRLLVVSGGVTGQLEDLGREVLEDGGEVDGGTSSDSLCKVERERSVEEGDTRRKTWMLTSVVALSEETVDTTDGELETGLGRSGGRLGSGTFAGLSFATFARHCKSELIKLGGWW